MREGNRNGRKERLEATARKRKRANRLLGRGREKKKRRILLNRFYVHEGNEAAATFDSSKAKVK